MALKPTIYKVQIELADNDSQRYESLSQTLALHPSETLERMAVRLLAFCQHWHQDLAFSRGLSVTDEPALWQHSAAGVLEHWIDVGHPELLRLRKACGRAKKVSVLAFAHSTDTWWNKNASDLHILTNNDIWS